jgi:hypothetical protein
MRRALIALEVLAVLALAPAALAGGFATVGLDSTPQGMPPGTPWNVNITVLQHGRTPLEGVTPTVTIRNGDATKTFTAKPTKRVGVYRASVTFPSAGKWEYVVHDGFVMNQAHSFPPVDIGGATTAAASTPADDGSSLRWLAIPGIAALVAALALLLVPRRRRSRHQPQTA